MNITAEPPETQTKWILFSWIQTSTVHAYPNIHMRGTKEECETRRNLANFPMSLKVVPESQAPQAY